MRRKAVAGCVGVISAAVGPGQNAVRIKRPEQECGNRSKANRRYSFSHGSRVTDQAGLRMRYGPQDTIPGAGAEAEAETGAEPNNMLRTNPENSLLSTPESTSSR